MLVPRRRYALQPAPFEDAMDALRAQIERLLREAGPLGGAALSIGDQCKPLAIDDLDAVALFERRLGARRDRLLRPVVEPDGNHPVALLLDVLLDLIAGVRAR